MCLHQLDLLNKMSQPRWLNTTHTLLRALEAESLRLDPVSDEDLVFGVVCRKGSLPVLLRVLIHHVAHSHGLIYT